MKKYFLMVVAVVNMACVCRAQNNSVVKMFPENGAAGVNIDTHLTLTMSDGGGVTVNGQRSKAYLLHLTSYIIPLIIRLL